MRKYIILLAVLIIAFLGVVGFVIKNALPGESAAQETTTAAATQETAQPTTEAAKEVTLLAVGDVLAHTPVLAAAKNEDGSYSFDSLFAVMKEEFQSADIAVVNQETILGGSDGGFPYDGYPNFNTPDSMGDAIIGAGFDVVLQASNHSRDAGVSGILHSINYWKNHSGEAMMLGLNETQAERDTIRILEKNGITFALLNYTYGLNGYSLPADQTYLVNIMDSSTLEQVKADITKASGMADFVIVFPHWGSEDRTGDPTPDQTSWAKMMTEAGADLIIGTHPHVIENIEWVTSDNGNRALCYYSIGNYSSNQQNLAEVLGGMAKVKIIKEDGMTRIKEEETGVVPIVTHNDKTSGKAVIQTYRLTDYTEEMAKVHDIFIRFDNSFSLARLQDLANQVFGDWILK
ncbi:CapA family protein [Parasporobacterium paucivorans]|uniref:Poly-gamma-glutamate synthesis protein (Capsule biosynthesis protein) n=1 Tax=Parasporobacterium paucivorans DSM 15970 TaxID=1122934 RepID=A0A1M6IBI1_9FIRM|nr:CapA family protein [Parasporobacterium paucivorans]SHJ31800.1 poly-gamma-glutamate synthesis protein (capsule biosynthesis protein) [Parasporobacterium paucivorans DSM 15970]